MADNTRTVKATCLCGDAAHEITLPSTAYPLPAYFCACSSCRHMTGTLFLSTAFLPPIYHPSPDLLNKLTSFKFSDRITQYFCKRCGSTMLAHCMPNPKNPDRKENWDVMTGTLETFDDTIDLKGYEYIHDTRDGGFSDFLTNLDKRTLDRWPYDINEETHLPLHWRKPQPSASIDPTIRLPAHCKCNGVRFYIARPSAQSTHASRDWPDLLIPFYEQIKLKDQEPGREHETWWLRANKTKFLAGLCSCDSCRLASGMEITAWAFVPKIDVSLDPEGQVPYEGGTFGTLQSYNSSEGVTRVFCSGCGAIVFFSQAEREKTTLLDVAIGLLDAAEGARAESWLEWRTERVSYRDDAVGRAEKLVEGIEDGLREFREKGYGRFGPAEEASEALGES